MSRWDRPQGEWMSSELRDMRGVEYKVGDRTVKACVSGRAVNISLCEVTRIENGKMYLDGSKVAVNFPGRMLIVNKVFE